jgi:hypothetical protein
VERHTAILNNRLFAPMGMRMSVLDQSAADFRREPFAQRSS